MPQTLNSYGTFIFASVIFFWSLKELLCSGSLCRGILEMAISAFILWTDWYSEQSIGLWLDFTVLAHLSFQGCDVPKCSLPFLLLVYTKRFFPLRTKLFGKVHLVLRQEAKCISSCLVLPGPYQNHFSWIFWAKSWCILEMKSKNLYEPHKTVTFHHFLYFMLTYTQSPVTHHGRHVRVSLSLWLERFLLRGGRDQPQSSAEACPFTVCAGSLPGSFVRRPEIIISSQCVCFLLVRMFVTSFKFFTCHWWNKVLLISVYGPISVHLMLESNAEKHVSKITRINIYSFVLHISLALGKRYCFSHPCPPPDFILTVYSSTETPLLQIYI